MKRAVGTAIRSLLGISLAAVLIYSVISRSGADVGGELSHAIKWLLVAAFVLNGFALCTTVIRWKMLLDVQGVRLPFLELARLTMIGVFFNLVIPGAVSGDVIKMVYVSGHSKGKTTEAVMTIMLDRVLGLFGLFLVSTVSIIVSLPYLRQASTEIQLGAVVVGCGSAAGIVFAAAMLARSKIQRLLGITSETWNKLSFVPERAITTARRLISGFDLYKERPWAIVNALLLSVLVHTILAIVVFSIGRGFHESNVRPQHYVLTTQVANAVGAIPITPAGFGSRDFVLSTFLQDAGASKAKAGIIPSFYSVLMVAWSLVGGIVFITTKRKRP